MKVRAAGAADLPGVLRLLAELPVTTGEGEAFELDEVRAKGVWDEMLTTPNRTVLVADDGGAVVGTADVIVVPNLTHDASPWAMVENVVVAESHRGGGVGQALMEEVIARARAAGCYKVQLLSFKERSEAHEFYRSLGFEALAEGFRMYF